MGGDNGKREKAPRAFSISVSQALPTITKESEVAVNTWCLTRKMLRILEFLVNIHLIKCFNDSILARIGQSFRYGGENNFRWAN